MASYMEMIFCDSSGAARKTGVGAAMASNALTYAAFNSYREFAEEGGSFLCDYYNAKGDLSATIQLSAASFSRITGEKIKTEVGYKKIDEKYWKDARAQMKKEFNHAQ